MVRIIRSLIALLLLTDTLPARAEILPGAPLWGQCPAEFVKFPQFDLRRAAGPGEDAAYVEADSASTDDQEGIYNFSGDVKIQRGTQRLLAERVLYSRLNDEAQAQGAVQIWQNNLLLRGAAARYFSKRGQGSLDNAHYYLPERHARGTAAHVDLQNQDSAKFTGALFTTCDEGDNAWRLHAGTLTLNTAENVGVATHVWIDFMHVPFFYFPYLSFPLSGRKSGFLVPSFGRSSGLGTRIALPYYWNIAPNRDATFTLQNFSDRGRQLLSEFRYLNPTHQGQLNVEYLPNDEQTGSDRSYLTYRHNWAPAPRWSADLNYRRVSDRDYLQDFGDRLSTASIVNLERNARVAYRNTHWSLQGEVVDYQTVDAALAPQDRPYRKLPQLNLYAQAPRPYAGLHAQFTGEFIRFDRQDHVSGGRLDLQPSLALPYDAVAGYLHPKFTLRQTAYALVDQAPDSDAHPTRTVPVFSLDGGLFFEREHLIDQHAWFQTLEPRFFYLRAPYRNQARLIVDEDNQERVFDSGLNGLSFGQLFQENRFSGGDRVGDADQVSGALTSRLIDAKGIERLSASLGRIYYFEDRRVTLPGIAPDTAPRSNIVGELRAVPVKYLAATATVQWDRILDEALQGSLQLRYQPRQEKIINLGVRFNRNPGSGDFDQQETDLSFFWPIHANWNLIGRRNYSMLYHRHKEWFAGVEYDSCCWAFRIVTRHYVSNIAASDWAQNPERQRALMLQLELKGLSNVGQNIQSLLEQDEHGIAGYR